MATSACSMLPLILPDFLSLTYSTSPLSSNPAVSFNPLTGDP
jgi:hypothetical protein